MTRGTRVTVGQVLYGLLIAIMILAVMACAGYGIYSAVDKYILTDAEEQVKEQEQEENQEEQAPDGTEGDTEVVTGTVFQNYVAEIDKLVA